MKNTISLNAKSVFVILTCIVLSLSGCGDKDQIDDVINHYDYMVGTWYDVEENEEITYTATGNFHDRFCNINRSQEIDGRYELSADGTKMTYTYKLFGETLYSNWNITDKEDLSFIIFNEVSAAHKIEKVVDKFDLESGDQVKFSMPSHYSEYAVRSYTSLNEYIASVDATGLISANGEKGTTYIKVETAKGNAWVKVVVGGDDCLDVWYDYTSFIGKDYSYVKSVLGQPDLYGDDSSAFGYKMKYHDHISEVDFFLDPSTQKVLEIGLVLYKQTLKAQVLSYMQSKYYSTDFLGDPVNDFTTSEEIEDSRAFVYYDPENHNVWFIDAGFFDLVPDFTHTFGMSRDGIAELYPLVMDTSIYLFTGNDFAEGVVWYFDKKTSLATAYSLILKLDSDFNTLAGWLLTKYYKYKQTDSQVAFIDAEDADDATLLVVLDYEEGLLIYYDLVNYVSTKSQDKCQIIEELYSSHVNNIHSANNL